jgi:transcriptional regulator with XRE-family HTH domain
MAQPQSPLHEQFGQRVRRQRDVLQLTQEEIAERSGLHVSYIAQVERGERNISLTNILRVADALDLDPCALVTGLKPPPA